MISLQQPILVVFPQKISLSHYEEPIRKRRTSSIVRNSLKGLDTGISDRYSSDPFRVFLSGGDCRQTGHGVSHYDNICVDQGNGPSIQFSRLRYGGIGSP
jgi:hypothetical protein